MALERFRIRVTGQCVIVVDLADESGCTDRYGTVAQALRGLGAMPFTRLTFALSGDYEHSILNIQYALRDLVGPADQIFIIGDAGMGMTCTALASPDRDEGISVAKQV
jgi:hypothetical protein